MPIVLLTDVEVAERLCCSAQTVKRLRLSGRLAYLPGRPPLVDEQHLAAYVEVEKQRGADAAAAEARAQLPPTTEEEMRTMRQRAMRRWLRRSRAPATRR